MLLNGEGVRKDGVRAYMWFILAEKAEYKLAPDNVKLARGLLRRKKREEAEAMAETCLASELPRLRLGFKL